MKIAQVAPIWTSVPPLKYGGAEKIISLLTDELVSRGHDITLFASGDSKTKARLISSSKNAPGLSKEAQSSIVNNMYHYYNMFLAYEEQNKFDIIHWHLSKDLIPLMFAFLTKTPSCITIHNHFYDNEMQEMKPIFEHYKNFPNAISISNYHRKYFPFNFIDTVYNGIDLDEFEFNLSPQDYMVWMGRFEYQKGADIAIRAAIELKIKLKIAAPKDLNSYYREAIEPFLANEYIEYIGEVDSISRNKLLKDAKIFINPIRWDEPFGLVVPEANACGVPVIAYKHGAMQELIKDGENGYLIENEDFNELLNNIKEVYKAPAEKYKELRQNCRQIVELNYTKKTMVDNYEKIYHKITNKIQ